MLLPLRVMENVTPKKKKNPRGKPLVKKIRYFVVTQSKLRAFYWNPVYTLVLNIYRCMQIFRTQIAFSLKFQKSTTLYTANPYWGVWLIFETSMKMRFESCKFAYTFRHPVLTYIPGFNEKLFILIELQQCNGFFLLGVYAKIFFFFRV